MQVSYAFLCLFFTLACTTFVHAQSNIAAKRDILCDSGWSFTENSKKYAGSCVDNRFRSPKIIGEDNSLLVIDNIYHDGQYWTASISKDILVKEVYVDILRFDAIKYVEAAHVQFEFEFAPGHEITLSDGSSSVKLDRLVVSSEAARPKDETYNFAVGISDNYALVARVISKSQIVSEKPDMKSDPQKIEISDNEKRMALFSAIKRGAAQGLETFYDTLRPNCTTEVFDIIDALPSLAGKYPTFLTEISTDPVAGPTLAALQRRGILKNSFNGRDGSENSTSSILLDLPGLPYSLVLFVPAGIENLENGEELVAEVQKMAYQSIPELVLAVQTGMLSGNDPTQLLLGAINAVTVNWQEKLRQLDPLMPEEAKNINLYFVPWNENKGEKFSLAELGVNARLPFTSNKIVYNSTAQEDFYYVMEGMRKIADERIKTDVPGYFMGANLSVKLQRGESAVSAQGLVGINPQNIKQDIHDSTKILGINIPVHIYNVNMPDPRSRLYRSVAIINVSQEVSEDKPSISIEFGAEGGLSPSFQNLGQFQIMKSQSSNFQQTLSTPNLDTRVASKIEADLDIFGVSFDPETLRISNIDVRMSAGPMVEYNPLTAMSSQSVNNKFTSKANDMLVEYKSQIEAYCSKLIRGSR